MNVCMYVYIYNYSVDICMNVCMYMYITIVLIYV